MKKLFAVLSAVSIAAAATMSVSASQYDQTSTGKPQTNLKYTKGESYIVTIPSDITLGNSGDIEASQVNIGSGKTLNVALTGTNESDNSFKLRLGGAADGATVSYTVTKDSETTPLSINDSVLTVAAGNTSGTSTLNFSNPTETTIAAGEYKGSVTFTISVIIG